MYLGCANKNVYCYQIETCQDSIQDKISKKTLNAHKFEITKMTLSKNEKILIVGTSDGVIYFWDLSKQDEFTTIEIHKDKGMITNLLPISKPFSMFGLNSKMKDSYKLPFLMNEGKTLTLGEFSCKFFS